MPTLDLKSRCTGSVGIQSGVLVGGLQEPLGAVLDITARCFQSYFLRSFKRRSQATQGHPIAEHKDSSIPPFNLHESHGNRATIQPWSHANACDGGGGSLLHPEQPAKS